MKKTLIPVYCSVLLISLAVSAISSGITCFVYFRKTAYHNLKVISKFCTNLMSDFLIIRHG